MNITMLKAKNYFTILLIFSAIIYLSAIGFKQLWKTDETRVAGISANMARTNEFAMPYLNGEEFLEYPPLFYWTTAVSYKVIGKTLFASRLSSALGAIFGVLLIFSLMRKMGYSDYTAFIGGIITATTGQFWAVGNRCVVDMVLTLFIICSFYSFYCIHKSILDKDKTSKLMLWNLVFVLSLGLGIMTKSLLGLVIPGLGLFFWLIFECFYNKTLYIKSWISLIICSLLSLIPAGVWVWDLYLKFGYEPVHTVVITNTLGRFFGTAQQHVNPILYYFEKLPEQFLPWTVLLVAVVVYMIYRKIKFPLNRENRLFLCWIIFPYILLCLSSGKRSLYLLPLYPAVSVIMALLLDNLLKADNFVRKFNWHKITLYGSSLLLVGFVTAGLVVAFAQNKRYTCISLIKYYEKSDIKERKLYLFSDTEYIRGALNYYLYRDVPQISSEEELHKVLNQKEQVCVLAPYSDDLKDFNIVKKVKVKSDPWAFIIN